MTIGFEFHPITEEPTLYVESNTAVKLIHLVLLVQASSQTDIVSEYMYYEPKEDWKDFVKSKNILLWAYYNEVVPVEVQERYHKE